jgi:pyruvate formate lyase activating enzyme
MTPGAKGLVFNIQRFSIHDGPGIRTTVFLKGCSLNCLWCHNPESINPMPQLQRFPQKCIGCGRCVKVCPPNAHNLVDGRMVYSKERCIGCGACAEACYAEALVLAGKTMTVSEVLDEIAKDMSFYQNSNGGVTFSGGEPLLQIGFLEQLLSKCKQQGIHTAVDTAGNVSWECFERTLPYTDLYLYDVKTFGEEHHREATGSSNRMILENLSRLSLLGVAIWIRIPVVPGINDSDEEMAGIFGFLSSLKNIKRIEMLPFHRMGEGKYASLGLVFRAKNIEPPSEEHLAWLRERWIPEDKRG